MAVFLLDPSTLLVAGLLGIAVVIAKRLHRREYRDITLASLILSFLGGGIVPYAIVLVFYPCYDDPPDFSQFTVYIPIAGIGLLWAGVASVWQSASGSLGQKAE